MTGLVCTNRREQQNQAVSDTGVKRNPVGGDRPKREGDAGD